jgi:hypothetical protein
MAFGYCILLCALQVERGKLRTEEMATKTLYDRSKQYLTEMEIREYPLLQK